MNEYLPGEICELACPPIFLQSFAFINPRVLFNGDIAHIETVNALVLFIVIVEVYPAVTEIFQ